MLRRLLLVCCLCVAGCCPSNTTTPVASSLTYLGQAQIGHAAMFDGTVIGGLSAISYDPRRQLYYVISDDRSAQNPARFYTVRLALSTNGIGVTFTGAHPLLNESGQPFKPLSLDTSPPTVPPDPEGIAYDQVRQRLYWSSEGERITDGVTVLADPWVRIAGLDGDYQGEFTLPPGLAMSAQNTGPRRNSALEGLTLTPDGRFLFAAMEEPGFNDGDPPSREHGALTRVTKFDVDTKAPVAQYAYPLEPAAGADETNGLTDLVALSDTTFLVVERAGGAHPTIRVFRAEIGAATDVLAVASMVGATLTAMTKSLAADLSATPQISPLDNIEGVTLGPRLPDGRQAVVFVSDDNFSSAQLTQFLLFAM